MGSKSAKSTSATLSPLLTPARGPVVQDTPIVLDYATTLERELCVAQTAVCLDPNNLLSRTELTSCRFLSSRHSLY